MEIVIDRWLLIFLLNESGTESLQELRSRIIILSLCQTDRIKIKADKSSKSPIQINASYNL